MDGEGLEAKIYNIRFSVLHVMVRIEDDQIDRLDRHTIKRGDFVCFVVI